MWGRKLAEVEGEISTIIDAVVESEKMIWCQRLVWTGRSQKKVFKRLTPIHCQFSSSPSFLFLTNLFLPTAIDPFDSLLDMPPLNVPLSRAPNSSVRGET